SFSTQSTHCGHSSEAPDVAPGEIAMPLVDVFEDENADRPLFVGEFSFLPRAGEYIATEAGGYFRHYNVVEVWYRQEGEGQPFRACLRVRLDD
ncbi:hypothetical protein, partial [Sphingosinicella rhizophila]